MVQLRRFTGAFLPTFLLAVLPSPVLQAWGVEGHHVVARLALGEMTRPATLAVQTILDGDDFVSASTWPDEIRAARPETANWHFVDIPYDQSTYDAARDCRPTPKGDCIIAALERDMRDVADTAKSPEARREALKFLIHFVGDLHQPLHAINNHDSGGNAVSVAIEGTPEPAGPTRLSLHWAWDTTLLVDANPDEAAYTARLAADLKAHPRIAGPIDVVKWAEDSHRLAVAYAYTYDGFTAGRPPDGHVRLDAGYQRTARPIIDQQLELAGVRLAAILNQTFGDNPHHP